MKTIDDNNLPIYIWGEENIDGKTITQASDLSNLPFTINHIALLPNAHKGYGAPFGSVMVTKEVLVPSAIGFDIGCGVRFCRTNLKSLSKRQSENILESLNNSEQENNIDWIGFENYEKEINKTFQYVREPEWKSDKVWELAKTNLKTLGGGNHFIELDKGSDGYIWMVVHTGSRNLGFHISKHYQKLIVDKNKKWYSKIPEELSFIPINHPIGEDFLRDIHFCIEYAIENRIRVIEEVKNTMQTLTKKKIFYDKEYDACHNFIDVILNNDYKLVIHRRGAICADKTNVGIILGSCGSPSYVIRGLENSLSFNSASNGSGRCMSRNEAQHDVNEKDYLDSIKDIIYKPRILKYGPNEGKVDLSDSKFAFKNSDQVIKDQSDLIEPLIKLEPIMVLKG